MERWRGIAPTLDQLGANLRDGLDAGLTPIRTSAERVVDQLRTVLDGPPDEDGFLAPLADRPDEGWSDSDWDRFAVELRQVVADAVRPALTRFFEIVENEALPRGRPSEAAGIGNLPGGADIYRALVRSETTTQLEPQEIHATGLAEVERIDGEMAELGRRVLGAESLAATQRRCVTTRACTSRPASRSLRSRSDAWPTPRPRRPSGSADCRARRAW